MVGLVPTIHVFTSLIACGVQDVDARHKGEHDELEKRLVREAFRFQPRRARYAVSVLRSRQAIVIGPTPPGTGVIAPATAAAST